MSNTKSNLIIAVSACAIFWGLTSVVDDVNAAGKKQMNWPTTSDMVKGKPTVHPVLKRKKVAVRRNPAFDEAEKAGLTIKGVSDVEGLERVISHALQQMKPERLLKPEFDLDFAEMHGLDVNALKKMDHLLRNGPIAIDLVEFIPGATGGIATPGLLQPFGEAPEYGGGEFTPAFPGKDSLASSVPFVVYRQIPNGKDSQTGGGRFVHVGFEDGSQYMDLTFTDRDGNKVHEFHITNGEGEVEADSRLVTTSDGEVISQTDTIRPRGNDPSQARREHEAVIQNEDGRREHNESTNDGDTDADADTDSGNDTGSDADSGSGDAPAEDPAIDQYQPADGEGTFCPMTVEVCRRQMKKALEDGENVLVGGVFINPARQDDTPKASRLVFDPEDLVINPSPEASRQRQPYTGTFLMVLPVWVNPPGPNE